MQQLVGGTEGRLLTYEEADSLKTSYADMIWGTANTNGSSGNFLYYWLGSANENNGVVVWTVSGKYQDMGYGHCGYDDSVGVRPVITASKSNLSN